LQKQEKNQVVVREHINLTNQIEKEEHQFQKRNVKLALDVIKTELSKSKISRDNTKEDWKGEWNHVKEVTWSMISNN
jgi:hypothetical protein